MRTKIAFIFLLTLLTCIGYAQLPDGSTAPDWTLQQINTDCNGFGQTWNLYSELNAGKHVVIDFSAIWCPPCWSYHSGGVLENLWNDYGPDGNNSIRVFYIEADCSTNSDCLCDLPGCNGNSQGNWMLGTEYPVFSPSGSTCTTINDGYSINYFPTLYAINAQYKTVWEVGQASKANWESWLFQSFALEAEAIITNVPCEDGLGSIDLVVSGGKPGLSYQWSNGANTQDLNNVAPGTYWVKITDANGYNITVEDLVIEGNSNPMVLNEGNVVDNICFGSEDGSITIGIAGGTAPYSFEWNNGATTQNISSLAAGDYMVTVTDANGCTKSLTSTVEQPAELVLNPITYDAFCGLINGGLLIQGSGGTPPFTYIFQGGSYTDGNFINLEPGWYSIGIVDNNECEVNLDVEVGEIPLPVSNAGPDKSLPCGGGTVQLDGTLSSSGAKWGYLWTTPNGSIVSGANTKTPIVNAVGTYILKVTDLVYGCFKFDTTLVISGGIPPVVEIANPNVLTCIQNNVVLNGTGSSVGQNISYLWTTPDGHIINGQDSIIATTDQPGTYTLLVTNTSTSCSAQKSVQVTANINPPTATVNDAIISCQQSNVQLCVNITSTYQSFQWQNGSKELCINVNTPGQYNFTVTGTNGCQFNGFSTVVADNSLPVANIAEHNRIQCGITSVSLTGTGSSSGSNYSYLWSTINGNIVGANNTLTINVDKAGKYFLEVINNANQCTSKDSTIVENGPVAPNAAYTHNVNYNQVVLTGLNNPYSVSTWVSGGVTQQGNTATFSYNDNGTYNVCHTITNDCGTETICSDIVISAILPLTFISNEVDVICYNQNNGSISAQASGGIGTYTYTWTGPNGYTASGNNITGLVPGIYNLVITDSGNHSVSNSFIIDQPSEISKVAVIVNASGNQSNGSIDLTVSGGVQPYTYLWSNGATTQDLNNVPKGDYIVTVTDANACVSTSTYTVGTSAVQEIVNNLIYKVYPNPTSDKVFIDLNSVQLAGSEMVVSDLNGRVIVKRRISSIDNTVEIDLSKLTGGVYTLKIENSKVAVIRKIVRL